MSEPVTDPQFTDGELLAWLDEALPADRMAAIERELRASETLGRRVAGLIRRRDQGAHTVGEIWRRHRLSCPTRTELGAYLLGTLEPETAEYIEFHIRTVGCRPCAANMTDLEEAARAESTSEPERRRRRFFQSSAGQLPRKR
jgi:hypothetical protein